MLAVEEVLTICSPGTTGAAQDHSRHHLEPYGTWCKIFLHLVLPHIQELPDLGFKKTNHFLELIPLSRNSHSVCTISFFSLRLIVENLYLLI